MGQLRTANKRHKRAVLAGQRRKKQAALALAAVPQPDRKVA